MGCSSKAEVLLFYPKEAVSVAKDDYHVIVYQILAYLYQQLKRGKPIDVDALNYQGRLFHIPERYYVFIMASLLQSGYITGIVIDRTIAGQYVEGLEQIQITAAGIEYLLDNSFLRKAQKFLRESKEVTPFVYPFYYAQAWTALKATESQG